jgi:hypothetical protein
MSFGGKQMFMALDNPAFDHIAVGNKPGCRDKVPQPEQRDDQAVHPIFHQGRLLAFLSTH